MGKPNAKNKWKLSLISISTRLVKNNNNDCYMILQTCPRMNLKSKKKKLFLHDNYKFIFGREVLQGGESLK